MKQLRGNYAILKHAGQAITGQLRGGSGEIKGNYASNYEQLRFYKSAGRAITQAITAIRRTNEKNPVRVGARGTPEAGFSRV